MPGASPARSAALVLAWGRVAIGVALAAAPVRALRLLGFRRVSQETILTSRLAGGRDLVLGAVALAAHHDPGRLATASLANAVVDAGDAAAFAAAFRAGRQLRPAALRGLAAAGPASAVGLWIASRLRQG